MENCEHGYEKLYLIKSNLRSFAHIRAELEVVMGGKREAMRVLDAFVSAAEHHVSSDAARWEQSNGWLRGVDLALRSAARRRPGVRERALKVRNQLSWAMSATPGCQRVEMAKCLRDLPDSPTPPTPQ